MEMQNELMDLELMEEQQILNNVQLQRKSDIQLELLKMYELEEQYWNERSNCGC